MTFDDLAARKLLDAIARGDEAALTRFYQLFERVVYAFVLRRISNETEAEEVVVETLYEVWKHASRFQGNSQVKTWVLGIARHKLLDKLRARGADTSEEVDENIPDDSETSFEWLARQQRAEHVALCMQRLTGDHRECLHLFFFEGMTVAEIAGIQQAPDNTIKTRLFHARKKIKSCLERMLRAEADDEYL